MGPRNEHIATRAPSRTIDESLASRNLRVQMPPRAVPRGFTCERETRQRACAVCHRGQRARGRAAWRSVSERLRWVTAPTGRSTPNWRHSWIGPRLAFSTQRRNTSLASARLPVSCSEHAPRHVDVGVGGVVLDGFGGSCNRVFVTARVPDEAHRLFASSLALSGSPAALADGAALAEAQRLRCQRPSLTERPTHSESAPFALPLSLRLSVQGVDL